LELGQHCSPGFQKTGILSNQKNLRHTHPSKRNTVDLNLGRKVLKIQEGQD
jgi:hypothetical protein